MKTLLQPTRSVTDDTRRIDGSHAATAHTSANAAAREGSSSNYGPALETEAWAELQARLADTEARLADALNRLSFREAESAAFAPDGVMPPRRAVLMARLAKLEQASDGQQSEIQDLRSIAKARESELGQAKIKLKALEKSAKLRESELGKAKAKLKLREADLVQAKARLRAREANLGEAKGKLEKREPRDAELGLAKGKPKAREAEPKRVRPMRLWKVVRKSVLAAGKSLGFAPKRDAKDEDLRRDTELVTASELFDDDWYLTAYPDVAALGVNPARHYLRHGAQEGRDPGPRFSTSKYLKRYPDVARAGMNPLLHYLKFGLGEQRAIFPANKRVAAATASSGMLRPHPAPEPEPALGAATVLSAVAPEPALGAATVLSAVAPEPALGAATVFSALEPEPALGAATVFSLPPVRREEAAWIRHEALCRRQGRATLELHGTILGWLPPSAQMVGTDSSASLLVIGAAALFCRMMRLGDAKALGCFEADAEVALPPADLRGAPLGRHFLPNAGPIDLADAWFASARDLRLRFAKPTPVLRFFQWDSRAGRMVLLSEIRVQSTNGIADIPTVNPLSPILIAASDTEGMLDALFLLPFPSLCRGGWHHGELLASEGESLMARLLTLSASLAETWLSGDQAFTIGRVDVDVANARGSEIIFSRAVQLWLDSCFDVHCRPVNGSAVVDERVRLYLEERLRGVEDKSAVLSERERSASYALQIGARAIPSLQVLVARGAPPVGPAGLGASILVDGLTGRPRWLLDLARLDAGLLENQWTDRAPPPKIIPVRERASQADQPAAMHAAQGFTLALTACNDSAARLELFGSSSRLTKSARAIRNPSAQPEISVLCPYWGDERHFAAFLDSLRLQTNLTNVELMVTAPSQRTDSGASLEDLVRRFFPDGQVISCDDRMLPGTRLNLMAGRTRSDLLLVAAGVLLHDPSTVDVLRHLAEEERAATVACVLRSVAAAGAAGPARLHCAGFYPDGKAEPHGVVAAFARLDSLAPLGTWTYPIAANPPPLFMTRKATWQELGGFNETLSDLGTVAVDFAVRATTRGYVHLCTSALAATVVDEAIAVTPRTISLPSATPPLAWRDAAARSVTLRTLVP